MKRRTKNHPGRRMLLTVMVVVWSAAASAHELWVETKSDGRAGEQQAVHLCWGHAGDKETGEALERQQAKVSARVASPGQSPGMVPLSMGADSFTGNVVPQDPGYHMVGGEVQIGILSREFHGIPANTRIVMYGKTFIHVPGSEAGLAAPLGLDLEVIPVGDPQVLRPGGLVRAKLLFHGKPLGGRAMEVSLNTLGQESFAEESDVQGLKWSVEGRADPQAGEIAFPLIVPGPHYFYVRYTDEIPGRYDGDLDFATEYSRLRKGETYERTLYISTFTVEVKPK